MRTLRWTSLFAPLLLAACSGPQTTTQTDEAYVDAMAAEHADETPTPAIVDVNPIEVLVGDALYHEAGDVSVTGYHARPAAGTTAGVVLVHEWWGLNENIHTVARQLAMEGYAVLAVDIYQGQSGETAEAARGLMTEAMSDPAEVVRNTADAAAWLRANAGVERVAVMGYCFGGGVSLNTAIEVSDAIDASVIYYGHLTDDAARIGQIDDPVLGLFGAMDQGIPIADVNAFAATAEAAGVDLELHVFDAGHAFANPSGTHYDVAAASEAWTLTLEFLERTLVP